MASLIFVCLHGFQSTPPARGATDGSQNRCLLKRFQSTPPARGATSADTVIPRRRTNFNPRPPRGERLSGVHNFADCIFISIHAPREGSDFSAFSTPIHIREFQSTPPARGATVRHFFLLFFIFNFNPRPPRGERLNDASAKTSSFAISIHAPREGSDSSRT